MSRLSPSAAFDLGQHLQSVHPLYSLPRIQETHSRRDLLIDEIDEQDRVSDDDAGECDLVALAIAMMLADEIDLQVAPPGKRTLVELAACLLRLRADQSPTVEFLNIMKLLYQ